MITKEVMELLQKQIVQYDTKAGNDYLIAFSKGKNYSCKICNVQNAFEQLTLLTCCVSVVGKGNL